MATLLQDLRYALHMLRRSPGFTAATLLTLALGVGANTAIFSLVDAVLLRQLPYRDPGRLVWLWSSRFDRDKAPLSIPDYLDFRRQATTVEQAAAFATWGANLTGSGEPERIPGTRIEPQVFAMLGVEAPVGRALAPGDERPDRPRVAVLTNGVWLRRFGGDPGVVGRSIVLNGDPYTVVGVLPRSFFLPNREAEIAVPLVLEGEPRGLDRGDHFLRAIARIRPGVPRERAEAELTAIARNLQKQYPVSNAKNRGVRLVPLQEEIVGNFRRALLVLLGAVGLLLLIACSNVANLLLARASARRREIAIRMTQGATRGRLVRQLMTESGLLALLGGAAGVLTAVWCMPLLAAASPVDLPHMAEPGLDARLLVFCLAASVACALVFGLAPALQASGIDPGEALRGAGRVTGNGTRRGVPRGAIVMAQVALSLVLLVAAGLLLRSFAHLQAVRPGFDPSNVLMLRLSLPKAGYVTAEDVARFDERVRARLSALPSVVSAGHVNVLPLSGAFAAVDFTVRGEPPPSPDRMPSAQWRAAGPGYFETMRIPLESGRLFTERDTARSPSVAIVSETLARRFFGGRPPVGVRVSIEESTPSEVEIVGVVADVKHMSLDAEATPDIYVPLAQAPSSAVVYLRNNLFCVVRTSGEPLALAAAARREIASVDRDVPPTSTRALEELLSDSVAPRRFNLRLIGLFGILALMLAAAGLHAVMAYAVTQRTREIGIRMALGASRPDVVALFVGNGMRLVAGGVLAGLVLSLVVTRLLGNLLFEVAPTDPVTLASVVLVLAAAAAGAAWLPARRASRIDPMAALRSE